MNDACQSFHAAIAAALGQAPAQIVPGSFQRFPTNGPRSKRTGWCKLFDDQRAGVFGCSRRGISEVWVSPDHHALTHAERLDLARQVLKATEERLQQQVEHPRVRRSGDR